MDMQLVTYLHSTQLPWNNLDELSSLWAGKIKYISINTYCITCKKKVRCILNLSVFVFRFSIYKM